MRSRAAIPHARRPARPHGSSQARARTVRPRGVRGPRRAPDALGRRHRQCAAGQAGPSRPERRAERTRGRGPARVSQRVERRVGDGAPPARGRLPRRDPVRGDQPRTRPVPERGLRHRPCLLDLPAVSGAPALRLRQGRRRLLARASGAAPGHRGPTARGRLRGAADLHRHLLHPRLAPIRLPAQPRERGRRARGRHDLGRRDRCDPGAACSRTGAGRVPRAAAVGRDQRTPAGDPPEPPGAAARPSARTTRTATRREQRRLVDLARTQRDRLSSRARRAPGGP